MICRDVQLLLHPYCDGELDLVRHLEIEGHLAECADCAEREKSLRSLLAALSSRSLYHRAPDSLRERVRLAPPLGRRGRWGSAWRLAATAAGVLLLLGASLTTGVLLYRAGPSADDQLAEGVVADHVRSLQVDHLTDVASSDQHTVKPWFRDKLDFSPQVPDLSGQGYALTGGRLDYLASRPVAALVYARRLHAINLFTWPSGNDGKDGVAAFSRQGFHVRTWQRSGMVYWAISDLNDQELDDFVRLFREHSGEARP